MKALVVGGTGTLGQELARQLLERGDTVRVFSRCELKQKQMAEKFKGADISFRIGDIRDRDAITCAMHGIDVALHCAALKHVDTLEFHPEEAIKTNVLGTMNVADAAITQGVRYVAFSSTDKAVSPINAYGMSKSLAEKLLFNRNRVQSTTLFSVFRWGNIAGSRGSVIPIFAKTLQSEGRAYLTHPEMTRFFLRIEDAVGFMLNNYRRAGADALIPPMKATKIRNVIDAVISELKINAAEIHVSGIRPGEKIHESVDECTHSDTAPQMTREEVCELVRYTLGVSA